MDQKTFLGIFNEAYVRDVLRHINLAIITQPMYEDSLRAWMNSDDRADIEVMKSFVNTVAIKAHMIGIKKMSSLVQPDVYADLMKQVEADMVRLG